MRCKILLLLLLCSCATQRQAEKYFDKNTDKLAAYVDQNKEYTQEHGAAYAAKHFPPKYYPPAIYVPHPIEPQRINLGPTLDRDYNTVALTGSDKSRVSYRVKTVFLPDTATIDSLNRELEIERMANTAMRQRLTNTEADRDYWREMNRRKFWTLVVMAFFALLYILFRVLASRVREKEV